MYRHLLVPIDGTDVSIEVVGNAVGLAHAVGARVTFLHAAVEPGGGRSAELLAKAEAASHASGVPCDSSRATRGSPAVAIVEAARSRGCDLIFMASPPKPGAAAVPSLLDGLLQAGLPVLLSNSAPGPAAHAIGVIRDEHRALAAVLHVGVQALTAAHEADRPADPVLMRAIVRYLQLFAVESHHPKEERHLFRRLRMRTNAVTAELDELERQHARERELVADLARYVDDLAAAGTVEATRNLEAAVHRYAAFQWEHLGREEGVVLPAAQRHLTPADWSAIDAGFAGNRDPGFGGAIDSELRQLFSRIVNVPECAP